MKIDEPFPPEDFGKIHLGVASIVRDAQASKGRVAICPWDLVRICHNARRRFFFFGAVTKPAHLSEDTYFVRAVGDSFILVETHSLLGFPKRVRSWVRA